MATIKFVSSCCGADFDEVSIFVICDKCNGFCEIDTLEEYERKNRFVDPNQIEIEFPENSNNKEDEKEREN